MTRPTPIQPSGDLMLRVFAMPADTNANGDIFGGWIMSHMDIAGGVTAGVRAKGRCATVAVDAMSFFKPVLVGDVVAFYTKIERVGTTSIAVKVEAWAFRAGSEEECLVTEGLFTYVAIDQLRHKRPIDK